MAPHGPGSSSRAASCAGAVFAAGGARRVSLGGDALLGTTCREPRERLYEALKALEIS